MIQNQQNKTVSNINHVLIEKSIAGFHELRPQPPKSPKTTNESSQSSSSDSSGKNKSGESSNGSNDK